MPGGGSSPVLVLKRLRSSLRQPRRSHSKIGARPARGPSTCFARSSEQSLSIGDIIDDLYHIIVIFLFLGNLPVLIFIFHSQPAPSSRACFHARPRGWSPTNISSANAVIILTSLPIALNACVGIACQLGQQCPTLQESLTICSHALL